MLTINHPHILSDLAQLGYGLLPARSLSDDGYILLIKTTKEAILTARLNQEFKIYLVPDPSDHGKKLGLITAFFDDHDEPIVLKTLLFSGDALLHDVATLLSQEVFEVYFFDEHNRELMGVRVRNVDATSFREEMHCSSFNELDMSRLAASFEALDSWFGQRDAADDKRAITIELGERLYPDDVVIIDARDAAYDFHGADARAAMTSLEREEPGPFQERDIAMLLRRAFPGAATFLNPMREDSGTELTDVLILTEEILLLVQAKDSPNTEASLRRSTDRKRSVIRSHIHKAAKQLRGAISIVQSRDEIVLRTATGPLALPIGGRALRGLVIVREMFDDDYKACSAPVLTVATEYRVPCVLLDYSAIHMMALHLPSPERLINGLDQLFGWASDLGEYPKPRFLQAPTQER